MGGGRAPPPLHFNLRLKVVVIWKLVPQVPVQVPKVIIGNHRKQVMSALVAFPISKKARIDVNVNSFEYVHLVASSLILSLSFVVSFKITRLEIFAKISTQ